MLGLGEALGQRMTLGEWLARAGGFESFGPGGGPTGSGVGVGGGVGVEDSAVEGQVGEAEPGGTFVGEVGEGALFEFGVLCGSGEGEGMGRRSAG